jgi:hypothetical protein
MAKPRRKHPGFSVAEGSPQGEVFISILMSFLGDEVWWKALEQTRDKTVIFLVGGSRGWGVLVERAERAEEDRWVHTWGFRYEPEGLGMVVQMDYRAHRWDPWLHAGLTGDRSLLEAPVSRRHRVQEARSWQTGRERDQYRMTVLPKDAAAPSVCGIALEEIEAVLERRAEQDGEGGHEVGMIRPAGSDDSGVLLVGEFPVVD